MTDHNGAVLEVDLDALAANYHALRSRHPSGPVAAVVKADAYGLGAPAVAARLAREGCRHFFVAHLSEARAILPVVAGAMVAVLNGFPPDDSAAIPVLNAPADLRLWADRGRPVIVHLDTGMTRLGLGTADLDEAAGLLAGQTILFVMTHLVSAEIASDSTNAAQAARFAAACARLPPAPRSLANASGIFLGPIVASDLARPGAALVGLNPTPGQPNPMRPVVRLTAPILQLRDIATGTLVGYKATWRAARPSRIATAAIGYADGLHRTLTNQGRAFFDGRALPLVGRVSMDLTTFDATDHPTLQAGDRIELIGPHQDADALATLAGTNGYEVLTSLSPRVRRVYLPA